MNYDYLSFSRYGKWKFYAPYAFFSSAETVLVVLTNFYNNFKFQDFIELILKMIPL